MAAITSGVTFGGVLDPKPRLPTWLSALGRGPGFMAFAFFCAAALFVLTAYKIDVSPLTGPLGVVCAGLYGGGGFKAWAEASNVNKPLD